MTASSQTASLSRRQLIKLGAAGIALGGATSGALGRRSTRRAKARNVVFLVVDGMSQGTFTLADMVIGRYRNGARSSWLKLYEGGAPFCQCKTASKNSLVTDSAAAACAWSTGVHMDNGTINIQDGVPYEPMLLKAKRAGKATGLVTTTRVTHATPAGFIANVPSRNMEDEIAKQILDRPIDLVMGGGARHFPRELLDQHRDVTVVRTKQEMGRAINPQTERVLGLFSNSHMPYSLDRAGENEIPRLPEMTLTALNTLDSNPEGFFLQVEAGRVDHGGHGNDAVAAVYDQVEYDVTIEAVQKWAANRDDTLVILTTDHGCGGPELTVYTDAAQRGFDRLVESTQTMTWAMQQMGRGADRLDRLADALKRGMDVSLTVEESRWLNGVLNNRERGDGFNQATSNSAVIASVLANHLGIAFVSGNHTAELVHTTAFGPGSEMITPLMDNIDLYNVAMKSAEISV